MEFLLPDVTVLQVSGEMVYWPGEYLLLLILALSLTLLYPFVCYCVGIQSHDASLSAVTLWCVRERNIMCSCMKIPNLLYWTEIW